MESHSSSFTEYQTIVTNYGECRCCLTKGNHRDIMKEYYYNGIREVFNDIFMECFNLYLSTNQHLSTLICSTCVSQLRSASTFKMLVLSTEQHLLEAVTDDKQTVFVNVPSQDIDAQFADIKSEHGTDVKTETDEELECDLNLNDNLDVSKDVQEIFMVEGEAALVARFRASSLRPLPSRHSLRGHCPLYVKHLDSLRGKLITAKSIEKLINPEQRRMKKHKKNIFVSEKMANIINASTLLEFSNATVFKTKMRSGYPCFYCRDIFENMDILREHQITHPKSSLFKLLSKYTADAMVVYADVTDLKCTICNENIPNLNELKSHLSRTHKKRIYANFEDRIVPFKLSGDSDYECQICGFNFETFGAIERHMNVHYRNRICEVCGAGFVTMHRLKVHNYTVHKEGTFPCNICKKVYATYNKYKIHFDVVHNMQKKNKCPKCPERFIDYFTRQKHLVEKHGMTPILYKCKVCDRAFSRRYTLSGHMKRCHLEEKEVQCSFCPYMCYTKSELRVHMLKHGTERMYECSVCKKSYTRQKTLKDHMRIHNNEKRYACSVCGQAFIQNCSLKGHMKSHHIEYASSL